MWICNFEQGHILLFIFDCLSARGWGDVVDWRRFGAAEAEDRRTKIWWRQIRRKTTRRINSRLNSNREFFWGKFTPPWTKWEFLSNRWRNRHVWIVEGKATLRKIICVKAKHVDAQLVTPGTSPCAHLQLSWVEGKDLMAKLYSKFYKCPVLSGSFPYSYVGNN